VRDEAGQPPHLLGGRCDGAALRKTRSEARAGHARWLIRGQSADKTGEVRLKVPRLLGITGGLSISMFLIGA
jgi:hypothetical protein